MILMISKFWHPGPWLRSWLPSWLPSWPNQKLSQGPADVFFVILACCWASLYDFCLGYGVFWSNSTRLI